MDKSLSRHAVLECYRYNYPQLLRGSYNHYTIPLRTSNKHLFIFVNTQQKYFYARAILVILKTLKTLQLIEVVIFSEWI